LVLTTHATGRLVLPGDKLCVVEEFIPASGAKALRDGRVVATIPGVADYDVRNHVVSVKPLKPTPKIKAGELVLCQVRDVQDKLLMCDILAAAGRPVRAHWTAAVVQRGETPILTVGDIVVARVVDEYYGVYTLSVRGRGLGVFQAFCDICGGPLTLSGRALFCLRCKKKYLDRPVVPYYGKVNTLLQSFGNLLSPEAGDLLWKSK